AENGFSMEFRVALCAAKEQYLTLVETISTYDTCLEQLRISVIAIARFRCFSSKLSSFLHIYNILGSFVLWI
ncbi:hypothetical protein KW475_21910, partial [Vibrio fluvialis]|nr:hypothetical protein [Vibrio fluvialis]